jgi:hypothetical protein
MKWFEAVKESKTVNCRDALPVAMKATHGARPKDDQDASVVCRERASKGHYNPECDKCAWRGV